jgi:Apea-like HEPN
MTATRPDATRSSFAVFPFLKTSGPVSIGNLIFRSTDDTGQLADRESAYLRDIAEMLFLKDDLRIHSASYVAVPYIDLERIDRQLEQLARVQAFVAYAYGSPHEVFGDPFLSTEHASLVIFSSGPVSVDLVRPDHHVDVVGSESELVPDQRHEIPGYAGLYNFRHHFWVAKGSRLYGPIPHLTLNISQDLTDLGARASRRDINLLAKALAGPATETSERILTAIRWFNVANAAGSDDATAIVSLAIAFETIIALPDREKVTERLTDAVALILGRIPRLDTWARQFYDTRSEIVHEGRARQLRFVASDSRKPQPNAPQYQSLLSYGRQIFQLCVEVLLTGADLAERAVLEDKLITNQERFERICEILSTPSPNTAEKLAHVVSQVRALDRFRFVSETGLRIETMLGATRLSASALLASDLSLDVELRERLGRLASAKRTADHYDELDALRSVHELVGGLGKTSQASEGRWATFGLVDVVWHYTFMHYFWLREQREAVEGVAQGPAPPAGNETSE